MNPVEIYTDGACKGNPGPGGWGVLMRWGTTERELFGGERVTTNNRMELTAVIEGLRALTRPVPVTLHVDDAASADGFVVGAEVEHVEWGRGTVMERTEETLTAFFQDSGYRTLSLEIVREKDLLRVVTSTP